MASEVEVEVKVKGESKGDKVLTHVGCFLNAESSPSALPPAPKLGLFVFAFTFGIA